MSKTEHTIQEIELEQTAAKDIQMDRDALDRLTASADFNRIIRRGYFEKEASRLVLLKAEAAMQEDQKQKDVLDSITGIGALYQYFRAIMMKGAQADAAMDDYEESLAELHQEALNEEAGTTQPTK